MKIKKIIRAILCLIVTLHSSQLAVAQTNTKKILVFSRTKGWKHSCIPFSIRAIQQLGVENSFGVDTTTNSAFFKDDNLKNYQAIIFNNTTGDVLNNSQQAAMERFIQAGGGFVGIHSAADTEYEWPWYNELVGAYFESHPSNSNVRNANVEVIDRSHISTNHLPEIWNRTDEWYNYKKIYHNLKPLAYLDESSYEGGTNGNNHPIAWHHEYDGGRAFYTGGGHTDESYSEPNFLKHLLGGIKYALGSGISLDYSKSYSKELPEENRFEKTVLVNDLNNPMELAVAQDGRVFFTELAGNLSVFDTKTNKRKLIHRFPLTMKGGTGLIGITLDPDFENNGWVYLYYSPPIEGEPIIFNLSRFTISKSNVLDLKSEKILLKVPVQINSGSHHGGSLAFDKDRNLILSTGDGTTPFPSDGYAPIDERPGDKYYPMDAQRSSANSNDLKGKILKIHPEKDGTYSIPEGNMFSPPTPKGGTYSAAKTPPIGDGGFTRPEIFAMGCRNPYRIAVNPKTSTIYWGEIGPDAGVDVKRGPRGYDEFNQAKKPGFYGWPYFVGNNYAYSEWNFADSTAGPNFDPNHPSNNSPNNTGLINLPKATPAMIWYPYNVSNDFPELGQGGRSAMAGEFYSFNKSKASPRAIPAHYDGSLFVFDWMRNWVLALRFDENENYLRNEKFMPNTGDFRRPIDLAFSLDGVMFMLEYGSVYGADNVDARLVKIEYNSGNRSPKIDAYFANEDEIKKVNAQSFLTSENKFFPKYKEVSGKAPLKFSAFARATDPDFDDKPEITWVLNGKEVAKGAKYESTLITNGLYTLTCMARDKAGKTVEEKLKIIVGNQKPEFQLLSKNNSTFYFEDKAFEYEVKTKDMNDKSSRSEKIITKLNYIPQPYRPSTEVVNSALTTVEPGSIGKTLYEGSDCKACHTKNLKSVGPSLTQIAEKYNGKPGVVDILAKKIIEGGGGNWGQTHVMSAHPQLNIADAREIVNYIFALSDPKKEFKKIPLSGTLPLDKHLTDTPRGYYNILAEYNEGANPGIATQKASKSFPLRHHVLRAMDADIHPGFVFDWGQLREGGSKSYLLFRNIDLRNIKSISFEYASKEFDGEIQIRKNSAAGPIIGKAAYLPTGSWDKMNWTKSEIDLPETCDLYFVAVRKSKPTDKIIKFKSIKFEQ
ncbi:MAG TPA: ThuA domain-containing protein [Leadbetterella sp.]|nr:ThuA domain-containing protein [Leadbetterella sp.]